MSAIGRFDWERQFRKAPGLNGTTRAVGFAMATYADAKTGANIWPSLSELAEAWGWNRSTITKAIASLRRAGWLELVEDNNHGGKPNVYRLATPQGVMPQSGTPGADTSQGVMPYVRTPLGGDALRPQGVMPQSGRGDALRPQGVMPYVRTINQVSTTTNQISTTSPAPGPTETEPETSRPDPTGGETTPEPSQELLAEGRKVARLVDEYGMAEDKLTEDQAEALAHWRAHLASAPSFD